MANGESDRYLDEQAKKRCQAEALLRRSARRLEMANELLNDMNRHADVALNLELMADINEQLKGVRS